MLAAAALSVRAATLSALGVAGWALPHFDTSSSVVGARASLAPLIRWDTHYFAQSALRGYLHEQELAFMPAVPFLARHAARALAWGGEVGTDEILVAATLLAAIAGVGATFALYR